MAVILTVLLPTSDIAPPTVSLEAGLDVRFMLVVPPVKDNQPPMEALPVMVKLKPTAFVKFPAHFQPKLTVLP